MSELTPELIASQAAQRTALRKLRQENESFFERRDDAIMAAHKLGMSLRDIGSSVGLSPQGVSNVIERLKGEQ